MSDAPDEPAGPTPDDYTALRERLDHPTAITFDPCAPTLAADDPEWPAPETADQLQQQLQPLPLNVVARLAFDGASRTLPWVESFAANLNSAPRDALQLVARRLSGGDVSNAQLDDAFGDSIRVSDEAGLLMENARAEQAALLAAYVARGIAEEHSMLFNTLDMNAWARCRALLPIADVATADIEWGELELPPRPVREFPDSDMRLGVFVVDPTRTTDLLQALGRVHAAGDDFDVEGLVEHSREAYALATQIAVARVEFAQQPEIDAWPALHDAWIHPRARLGGPPPDLWLAPGAERLLEAWTAAERGHDDDEEAAASLDAALADMQNANPELDGDALRRVHDVVRGMLGIAVHRGLAFICIQQNL